MHISGMVHVNINCRDYERSKAFYEMLGFREVWAVPETNTPEVAAAVGMPPYRVRGAIMAIPDADPPMTIDLLEWVSPRDESDPYPNLHRPGIARLAMRSTDLAADYAELEEAGVDILSPPATVMMNDTQGTSFFCFRDPDGTYLELVEQVTVDPERTEVSRRSPGRGPVRASP